MCSKNAKPGTAKARKQQNGAGSPVLRFNGLFGTRSITWRLTLLYVSSTAALLLLSTGFLYWTLKRSLDATRYAMLASKIEVLRLLLREQPDKADVLASEVEHEASESQPLRYYVRVLDEEGRTVVETSRMKELVPASLFPPPVETTVDLRRGIEARTRQREVFLLLSAQAAVGTAGREQRTLQIAVDTSVGTALLADYRRKLLAMLGAGLLFAAVAGVWVARKGMQPLVEVTRTAQHITASQLHERIAGARWPAELAELASAFDAMLDRLEDSFTRLSQFSADLAHELRTPINNLRGEAEVTLARVRTPEEYQHVLASSLEEYERLARMIDGLLFLARADDPNTVVERVRFDARKEVEAVREFYDALAREQEVEVICEGNSSLTGDPLLFRRAVSNLVANAVQHTPAKGSIRISVLPLDDQAVELSVRDTGSGIAAEHLPKIFDRFYRAGQSRSQAPGGTGLGLAIVQSIARRHGGTARIQSVLGQGTTVTIRFPGDKMTGM
jgi:two-component system heavy metal sensor histidine kinase CusS